MTEIIPWDELGTIYNHHMGAPSTPSRVVIGALTLKHMKKLTDEEIIEDIRENPYFQYFLGSEDFQYRTVFVPSLFVEIRKRLGMEQLQEINELFLSKLSKKEDKRDLPESGVSDSDTISKGQADGSAEAPEAAS